MKHLQCLAYQSRPSTAPVAVSTSTAGRSDHPSRNKIILIFGCTLLTVTALGQTCQNPGARLARLTATTVTKDSIHQRVKNDLDFIRPTRQDTIADIGSFDGYYPAVYSIFSDSVVFYLNDITNAGFAHLDSIKAACARIRGRDFSNKFIIRIGTDSSTNLPGHFFNKVVIRDALHHFKSKDAMLLDVKRIMKPQASLILFEPVRGRNLNTETLCKGAMTAEELLGLMNKNGFTLTRELSQNTGGTWFEFRRKDD